MANDVDTSDLEQTFDAWLDARDPHASTAQRLSYWFAFKAGAEWAMAEIRKNARLPETQPDDVEALRRG
jgi:hypothetical protein